MFEIVLNPEVYKALMILQARQALIDSPIQRRTGALLNSIDLIVEEGSEGDTYRLVFNDYGLFLDEGVQGTLSGRTGGGAQGLQFRFSGRFRMIGGDLPYGARTNIYKFGLEPRPWIYNAITNMVNAATEAIENDLVDDIEDVIVQTIETATNGGQININI